VGLHEHLVHPLDLGDDPLVLREGEDPVGVAERGARRERPVEVVHDQPAARTQQLVDQEEGEPIDRPAVRPVQIAHVEARLGILLQHLHQPPVVAGRLVEDRHPAPQAQVVQEGLDRFLADPLGLEQVDSRDVPRVHVVELTGHVRGRDPVLETELQHVPHVVVAHEGRDGCRVLQAHVGGVADDRLDITQVHSSSS